MSYCLNPLRGSPFPVVGYINGLYFTLLDFSPDDKCDAIGVSKYTLRIEGYNAINMFSLYDTALINYKILGKHKT